MKRAGKLLWIILYSVGALGLNGCITVSKYRSGQRLCIGEKQIIGGGPNS